MSFLPPIPRSQSSERRSRGRRASDRGQPRVDRRQRERRAAPRPTPDRRKGPRRLFDRRKQSALRTLLATFLCMLCLAAPPMTFADDECVRPAVELEFFGRPREVREFSLARCDGTTREQIIDELSLHLRPRDVEASGDGVEEGFVAPGIRRLDVRLIARLQSIAEHWPDRRITVVSAYRARCTPCTRTSKACPW